jgi:Uma2 family endonuclease
MSSITAKPLLTPDDLLRLSNAKSFELIEGELVERNGSVRSSWIGGNLLGFIGKHVSDHDLGWVFGAANGCQCFANFPNTVRRPNVSFVKKSRMTWDEITHSWLRIVPDLIVEVIAPNDLAYHIDKKVEMFFEAGVPLIWDVNPAVWTVRVIRSDGTTSLLREGNDLSGEDILPGFACPVASIFPPRPPIVEAVPQP